MRAVTALAILMSLGSVNPLDERRQLRKDYHVSSKSGKSSSSSKSSKGSYGSSKSSKGSDYSSSDYEASSKSNKGGSKSSKSSFRSSKSIKDSNGYDDYEGHTKPAKYHDSNGYDGYEGDTKPAKYHDSNGYDDYQGDTKPEKYHVLNQANEAGGESLHQNSWLTDLIGGNDANDEVFLLDWQDDFRPRPSVIIVDDNTMPDQDDGLEVSLESSMSMN